MILTQANARVSVVVRERRADAVVVARSAGTRRRGRCGTVGSTVAGGAKALVCSARVGQAAHAIVLTRSTGARIGRRDLTLRTRISACYRHTRHDTNNRIFF